MIYRPRFHSLLKGARKSFAWQDYRDLLVRAHVQLGAPITVVWDNLNTHRTAGLRDYAADHDWLTIVQLPSYSQPGLEPGGRSLVPVTARPDGQHRIHRP